MTLETRLEPQNNVALEGLYRSSGNFCTQRGAGIPTHRAWRSPPT